MFDRAAAALNRNNTKYNARAYVYKPVKLYQRRPLLFYLGAGTGVGATVVTEVVVVTGAGVTDAGVVLRTQPAIHGGK